MPVTLQTICIRHQRSEIVDDAQNTHSLAWVDAINQSGDAFMLPSQLKGRWMVRVSIGVESTEREHVQELRALIQKTASNILRSH
jgi:aromatic-L-amino-acid decarboxylase